MSVALEARDITKVYGHVSALSGANFEVKAGEVTALIGDNGAGKSTLIKILSGTETPTSGEILVDGQPVTIDGPLAARRYGIETVYQDLALAPHLNPVQNMYLGREAHDDAVAGRDAVLDHAQVSDQLTKRHIAQPRNVVLIDHVDEFARLLGADGGVGEHQRLIRRRGRHLDAREHARRE